MNKTITAAGAPAASGPYCHAKLAGNMLFVSGQLGVDAATGALAATVEEQAKLALASLGTILKAAGMDYTDVVKTTVFLADINDFAAINAIYADVFHTEPPARSCFQVANLPKNALFEIEAIAVKG
ncbi:RidA family protein [Pseudoflavonifractor sp. 524-17]|uniref:RidA family protein n=1 Tax=Pseudoflavonifractor sp. 524-17 TaxID=2304577 RepID=UPI00137A3758|nr:Rid family detoxifying hydrolase [Pseudoflavonifractor sp. 524-17]NCE63104.1 RidA family protein [Pseudoflavonifractor sp. 524-17]